MINPLHKLLAGRRVKTMITMSIAGVIILTVIIIATLTVLRQKSIFEQQFEEKGLALSRTLNDVLANSLYFRDRERLRHLADVAKAQPEIESLTVFAPDGRILVAPGAEKFPTGSVAPDVLTAITASTQPRVLFHDDYVEVLAPVVLSDEVIGGIRIRFDKGPLAEQIDATIAQHVIQGLLIVLIGIGVSAALAQAIARPVREMVGVADRIASGDFEFTLEQERSDEIGDLARSLEKLSRRLKEAETKRAEAKNIRLRESNELLRQEIEQREKAQRSSDKSRAELARALDELKQTQDTLVQQERLRAVGQMTSGIAHDINNRLQVILGLTEELIRRPNQHGEDVDVRLNLIRDSVSDAAGVIHLLADFYRPQSKRDGFELLDIAQIIQSAVQLTEPRWKDQALQRGVNLQVDTELEPMPKVYGSASELREALINIIFNAIDAMPSGGRVVVRGCVRDGHVAVEVVDTGLGMSEAVRQRCMEPFFTTKGERGSGLGLAMIYRTAKRHEAELEIDSQPGLGTTVRLCLPVREQAVATPSLAPSTEPCAPADILVVDDEPMVRDLICSLLAYDGHRVTSGVDGTDGLAKFQSQAFDLVIVDRAMPGMNGDELARNLKALRPHIPVIMLTGFGGLMSATGEVPPGIDLMLGKPIRRADLSAAVRQAINAAATGFQASGNANT